jgi:hypothetical protein
MKFKHLFYRVKATVAAFLAPSPEAALKALTRTSTALVASVKGYNAALNAERDLRLESYVRQYDVQAAENAVREASDGRTESLTEAKARAQRVAERIDAILA